MNRKLTTILTITLVTIFSGCLRGESKSLSEIFNNARDRFLASNKEALNPEVTSAITALTGELDKLTSSESISIENLAKIEESLSTLLPQAGYTIRPSLTEVRNQFLEATENKNIDVAQAKMLATRAYNIISEELAAGKFQINKN
jgi:hypothetical protein